MAKMKISELSVKLGVNSKEIIAFLQEKGIEAKAPTKGLEEAQVALVESKFAKGVAGKGSAEGKASAGTPDKAPENPKDKIPEKNTSAAGKPDDRQADKSGDKNAASEKEVVKKKKKIIVISNPSNSKMPAGHRPPGAAPQQQKKPSVPVGANGKPIQLGPNQMINKATGKIMEKLPPKREVEEEKPAVEINDTPATHVMEEKPAAEKINTKQNSHEVVANVEREASIQRDRDNNQDRSQKRMQDGGSQNTRGGQNQRPKNYEDKNATRRNGDNTGDRSNGRQQGERNSNRDGQGFNRNGKGDGRFAGGGRNNNQNGKGDFANNDRGQGRNGRPGDRSQSNIQSKGFGQQDGLSGKNNSLQEQRRQNQLKDKRSKKDAIYEEDEIKNKSKAGRFIKPEKKEEVVEEIKVITIPEVITIKELADKMKMQPSAIIKKLFMQGRVVTVNQEISYEDAENIAIEFDIMCEQEVKVDVIEELLREEEEDTEKLVERAPVICVMGHVDHGKTSLLDAIRKTNVTDREAGGITQHIGAYTVHVGERKITFLDTPGHEAFTAMRMRGANATDIAILVVAADDGVMPQTVEAINHAKAAGIEIIVAVNKIDKPSANVEKVKQELTEYGLISEDWGGSTIFAPVSAKSGEGIKELLDMVLLTADIMELKANPRRKARGLVIEAELDKGRGPVATVLVQKGTLKVGDFVSAGASNGKVRAMIDDKGRRVREAGPSIPVEILGLNDVPNAGEVFIAHESDKQAKQFADTFIAQNKVKKLEETKSKMSLDDVFAQIREGNLKELNLIVKADVQGSVEAVKQSLVKLSNEEVLVKCIHGGVGAINESDVSLAVASSAIIIGFNVRIDATAKDTADREGVDVRLYKVIYQAIEDVEAAMKGMLDPVFEERILGHAEVRQIFKASAVGNIAGSYILDGVFTRGCKVRITREGEQIYEGALASLKRFKDDVKEVKTGFECGLVFEGFDGMQELDIVEAYDMVEVPR